MTLLEVVLVGVGGFLGAVMRHFISGKMNGATGIPVGTLVVNLVGSLLIGIVFGMDLTRMWALFFASGLAGALTTFSTWNKEIIDLWRAGNRKESSLYAIITVSGGIVFACIGYFLGSLFK